MIAFVLIAVFAHGYGPRPMIEYQEFSSKERCELAAKATRKLWHDIKLSGSDQDALLLTCVEK